MLNNVSVFFGTSNVGKCYIAAYTAKMLSLAKKTVLIIDTSRGQNILSMFNLSEFEMSQVGGLKPLIRDNIEIIVKKIQVDLPYNEDDFEMDFVPQNNTEEILKSFKYESYDSVLVIADETLNEKVFKEAKLRFLVQNYDKGCLLENADLLGFVTQSLGPLDINVIYYQMPVKTKFNIKFINEQFKNYHFVSKYEIPFDIGDFQEDINNSIDGNLNLKNFSAKRKEGIFEIANDISDLKKTYKNYNKVKGV